MLVSGHGSDSNEMRDLDLETASSEFTSHFLEVDKDDIDIDVLREDEQPRSNRTHESEQVASLSASEAVDSAVSASCCCKTNPVLVLSLFVSCLLVVTNNVIPRYASTTLW